MLQLILVRHGETDSNKKQTYYGWTDTELNEVGIRQACCVKEKLKGIKVDAMFSSPLKRARQTAEIINENFNLEIVYTDSLKERNFGIWEELTYENIKEGFPEEHDLWLKDWMNYCIKNGESAIQAYNRVAEFIDGVISSYKDGIFAIVTHLGCIRIIPAYLMGMGIDGIWRFSVDNGSISKLEITGEKYVYLNLLNG